MPKNQKKEIERLMAKLPELSDARKKIIFKDYEKNNAAFFSGNNKRVRTETFYYTVVTKIEEWQVIRKFVCHFVGFRKKPSYTWVSEVMQQWLDRDGNHYYCSKKVNGFCSHYYDAYLYQTPITYRGNADKVSYYARHFKRIAAEGKIYINSITWWMKQKGLTRSIKYASLAIPCLAKNDYVAETLAKTGNYEALDYYAYYLRTDDRKHDIIRRCIHVFKICYRHNYKITDFNLWFDMLVSIDYCNGDTHNPKFVCPENLAAMHDLWFNRMDRKKNAELYKQQLEEAKAYEEKYLEEKRAYLGIRFGKGNLRFHVLGSPQEHMMEGRAMHHCVFRMKYYKSVDMLILSCTDTEGNRLETIRVNLNTYKVEESRALQNKESEYHEEILKQMKSNMYLIRKASKRVNKQLKTA